MRAKFLSVIQGREHSNGNFLARLRIEARYCDFQTLRTTNTEKSPKIKIICSLRDPETKLGLLDSKKHHVSSEMTENVQFRGQAMAFVK